MLRPTILIQYSQTKETRFGTWKRFKGRTQINLNEYPNIQSEGHLCRLIYERMGEGDIMIIAWKKGRRGFWVFWKGIVNKEGFMFQSKKIHSSDSVRELKEEYNEETDEDYKKILQELIDEEVKEREKKKYGFEPYLIQSGRKGEFILWEDIK